MNLLGVSSGVVGAVNPNTPVSVQISTGSETAADGTRAPAYATPGAFTGSIAGQVLTVATQTQGKLLAGQQISGTGVLPRTCIKAQLSGTPGGVGTYQLIGAPDQTLTLRALTAAYVLPGNVQAMQYRDLMQVQGLNLNGTRRKVYLYGDVNGIVRVTLQGGDLITDAQGNVWLTAMVLEQWHNPAWCSVAVTLQNGS